MQRKQGKSGSLQQFGLGGSKIGITVCSPVSDAHCSLCSAKWTPRLGAEPCWRKARRESILSCRRENKRTSFIFDGLQANSEQVLGQESAQVGGKALLRQSTPVHRRDKIVGVQALSMQEASKEVRQGRCIKGASKRLALDPAARQPHISPIRVRDSYK